MALQFAAAGYHTAVLRYAVGDDAAHGLPLRQLAAAIGLVRQHAAAWHVQPDKIAVCGFSAGGHLALSGHEELEHMLSTQIYACRTRPARMR